MNVLFVCSDNSVLSIMAESIMRAFAARRFEVFSAGCLPRPEIDGYVLRLLAAHRMPLAGLCPKSLEPLRFGAAPKMEFIVTLSDLAAAERWSEWPGEPLVTHWKVWDRNAAPSPSAEAMVRDAFWTLRRRIQIFSSLLHRRLSPAALARRTRILEPSYL